MIIDAISNRAVPIKAILEVNEMLLELEDANEDVSNEIYEDEDHNTDNENEKKGSVTDENEGFVSNENDEKIIVDL